MRDPEIKTHTNSVIDEIDLAIAALRRLRSRLAPAGTVVKNGRLVNADGTHVYEDTKLVPGLCAHCGKPAGDHP